MSTGELWAVLGSVLGLYALVIAMGVAGFRWADTKFDRVSDKFDKVSDKIDQIHRDIVQHLRDDHGIQSAGKP